MKIEEIKIGSRVWVNLQDGGGKHYAKVDSIQPGLLSEEPVVLIIVLGELKSVSPGCLEKIKREKNIFHK